MRSTASFVRALLDAADASTVVRACEMGQITARQAASALKAIGMKSSTRESPLRTELVKARGAFVGEIVFDGVQWEARRYGSSYPGCQIFNSETEALKFLAEEVAGR